eukprot:scaffold134404_cov66-Attheya_sp.AAC.5
MDSSMFSHPGSPGPYNHVPHRLAIVIRFLSSASVASPTYPTSNPTYPQYQFLLVFTPASARALLTSYATSGIHASYHILPTAAVALELYPTAVPYPPFAVQQATHFQAPGIHSGAIRVPTTVPMLPSHCPSFKLLLLLIWGARHTPD